MNRKLCIPIGATLVLCLATLSGCGRMVSTKTFMNNAFQLDGKLHEKPSSQTALANVPPKAAVPPPAMARVIERSSGPAIPPLDLASARGRAIVASDVRRELEGLERDMTIISSMADQKGAEGRAALAPKARGYRTEKRDIMLALDELSAASNQWQAQGPYSDLESLRDDLRRTVIEAADSVGAVSALQYR